MRMKQTNTKIVGAGPVVTVTRYLDEPLAYDYKRKKEIVPDGMSTRAERRQVVKDVYWTEERREKEREDNRRKAMLSASNRLKELVNANAWQYRDDNGRQFLPAFATFTFAKDVRDVEKANEIFTLFIKRLNFYVYKDKKAELKYVNVIEFQDKNRNGVVHYHTLFFNLPYVYKKKLEEIWYQGYIRIEKVDRIKNLAGYMAKYMVKGFEDPRLDGKKRYFPSKGLLRPTVVRDELTAKAILSQLPEDKLHSKREFESEYVGRVVVRTFILNKGESLEDVIDFVL